MADCAIAGCGVSSTASAATAISQKRQLLLDSFATLTCGSSYDLLPATRQGQRGDGVRLVGNLSELVAGLGHRYGAGARRRAFRR